MTHGRMETMRIYKRKLLELCQRLQEEITFERERRYTLQARLNALECGDPAIPLLCQKLRVELLKVEEHYELKDCQ